MTSDHTHAAQETIVSDTAVQAKEQAPEATAGQLAKGGVSPYSLVPALTLIALQFIDHDLNPFEAMIQSMGNGKHRPTPQK